MFDQEQGICPTCGRQARIRLKAKPQVNNEVIGQTLLDALAACRAGSAGLQAASA